MTSTVTLLLWQLQQQWLQVARLQTSCGAKGVRSQAQGSCWRGLHVPGVNALMQALEDLYVHYDETVRNAAGGVVQFSYGDDGMDPLVMEGKDGKPLDFEKLLAKVRSTSV